MSEQVIWENKNKKLTEKPRPQASLPMAEETRNPVSDQVEGEDKLQEQTLASLGIIPPKPVKKIHTKSEPKNTREKGRILRIAGSFLIIISLLGLAYTLYPIAKVEVSYRVSKLFGQRFQVENNQAQPERTTFGDLLGKPTPTVLVPKSTDFGIVVEKIGANAPVIANVNAANQREYNRQLQKGVAHAATTALPGQNGLSFLFAHSVLNPWDVPRYNAVFYLLRELEAGDRIVIFWQGRRYDYITYDKKIVGPTDVGFLYQNYTEPILVLQTCDPPGTTWRRLLIFARLASAS